MLYSWTLLSGLLGVLSFSPFNHWPFSLISMGSLMQAVLYSYRMKQAMGYGFCWGVGFFGLGLHWIAVSLHNFASLNWCEASLVAGGLVLYLTIYPMLAAGLWYLLLPHPSKGLIRYSFGAAVIWQLTDLARATLCTGFPWLAWGYGQVTGPFSGIAPLGGVDAITFLLVWTSALVLGCLQRHSRSGVGLLLAICLFLGWAKGSQDSWTTPEFSRKLPVLLVQGNQPQSLKWSEGACTAALQTYRRLSSELAETRLLIWPEVALPCIDQKIWTEINNLSQEYKQKGVTLLTGLLIAGRDSCELLNGIRLLGVGEDFQQFYVKQHLVPFGEYIPGPKWILPLLKRWELPVPQLQGKSLGKNILTMDHYYLLPTICYEVLFGGKLQARFAEHVDCLITLSNDSWFLNTVGPWQHHQIAQMRALELGRPLLRSTNNGITSVIDHLGKIGEALPQFQEGQLAANVTPRRGLTPYAKWGNVWLHYGTCIGFVGYLWKWWSSTHPQWRRKLWKR